MEPSQKSSNPDNISKLGHNSSNSNGSNARAEYNTSIVRKSKPRNLSLPDERMVMSLEDNGADNKTEEVDAIDGNPLRLLRQNKGVGGNNNVLPLPPRDRHKATFVGAAGVSAGSSQFSRHQRKHPLLIPSKISITAHSEFSSGMMPPPPPPKPVRQHVRAAEAIANEIKTETGIDDVPIRPAHASNLVVSRRSSEEPQQDSVLSAVIESLRKNHPPPNSVNQIADKVKLYENYESSEVTMEQTDSARDNGSADAITMRPRVPRGDSPQKITLNQTQNLNQGVHRRIASLDLTDSYQNSSNRSTFETNYQPDHDLLKIRTVRRILGSSVSILML